MENSPSKQTAAIEELIKGRESAAQLGLLVQKSWSGDSSVAGELIEEVLSSFSRALHVLDSEKSTEAGRSPVRDSVLADGAKSESCGKKRKNSAVGIGRGGFRKRKQSSQWRTVISNTFHDEYSWRKYGQKQIHHSKFPRSYFRCTHKYDQGCAATKQVQKSEDDPSVFVITYMGQHSCTSSHIMSNLIVASNSSAEPSIISFGSNASNVTQDFSLPSSSLFSKRQECDEEVLSSLRASTPSSEIFDLPSLCEGSVRGPVAMESAPQHGGESSGLHSSTSSLDLRFMMDSLSFADALMVIFSETDFIAVNELHLR